jgi:hypothetical protein
VCQWCGSSIPQPAAPPVQPSPATVIITERGPGPGWGRSPGGVAGVIVFVAFVIIILVAAISLNFSMSMSGSGPSVDITGLNVMSSDNACALNGDDSGNINLHPPGGGIPFILWGLPGPGGSLPCTVQSVSTNTPGFSLFGSLPYTATSFPGSLAISMFTPSSFSGVLNVTFT